MAPQAIQAGPATQKVDHPAVEESGPSRPARPVEEGSGGLLDDPHQLPKDLRLINRAIKKRWPTQPRVMDALLTKTARIGIESQQPRVVFSALRGYMAAERMNQLDDLRGQAEVVVHAHLDVTARAAAAELSVEELRVLRSLRARITGADAIDVAPDPGGLE